MANPSVSNIQAAKPAVTGGVSAAIAGTAVPTTASASLAAAFKALGYIGEDGVAPTDDRSVEKKKAWGGDIVKSLQTEHSKSFQFTLLEAANVDVLNLLFAGSTAGNVAVTAATVSTGKLIAIKETGEAFPHNVFVFDTYDGKLKERIVVPDGQITTVEEGPWVDSDTRFYTVTVEAFKDSSGVKVYRYIDDGVFSA
jgi:hypothetical protein